CPLVAFCAATCPLTKSRRSVAILASTRRVCCASCQWLRAYSQATQRKLNPQAQSSRRTGLDAENVTTFPSPPRRVATFPSCDRKVAGRNASTPRLVRRCLLFGRKAAVLMALPGNGAQRRDRHTLGISSSAYSRN